MTGENVDSLIKGAVLFTLTPLFLLIILNVSLHMPFFASMLIRNSPPVLTKSSPL